jgi:hypothetical protein
VQTNLGSSTTHAGAKANLGQATLQRHLAAFEAYFMEATRTGMLTLVTTTTGFAQA